MIAKVRSFKCMALSHGQPPLVAAAAFELPGHLRETVTVGAQGDAYV